EAIVGRQQTRRRRRRGQGHGKGELARIVVPATANAAIVTEQMAPDLLIVSQKCRAHLFGALVDPGQVEDGTNGHAVAQWRRRQRRSQRVIGAGGGLSWRSHSSLLFQLVGRHFFPPPSGVHSV